jgi:hypothetical protein
MRSAETVLGILRERGRRGLPLERVYRWLFNRNLYLLAYGKIARNHGALTPGATPETADGMTLAKIDAIIEALRFERYRWTPVRRAYVSKANGKRRPLGLPSWSDKLLGEVLRLILHRLDWLRYTMERSLVRTLGHKLRLSDPRVCRRFGATLQTPNGPRKGLAVHVERLDASR